MNSLRRCSLLDRESAMALNASASSPTSSLRFPTSTRTSRSPWPNCRAAAAISLLGLDWRRLVTELMMAAMRMTAPAVTRKIPARSFHMPLISAASQDTSTSPCKIFWLVMGRPTRYRGFSYKPPSVVAPAKFPPVTADTSIPGRVVDSMPVSSSAPLVANTTTPSAVATITWLSVSRATLAR